MLPLPLRMCMTLVWTLALILALGQLLGLTLLGDWVLVGLAGWGGLLLAWILLPLLLAGLLLHHLLLWVDLLLLLSLAQLLALALTLLLPLM